MLVDDVEVRGMKEIYEELVKSERLNYEDNLIMDGNGRYSLTHKNERVWLDLPHRPGKREEAYAHISYAVGNGKENEIKKEKKYAKRLFSLACEKGYDNFSKENDGHFFVCKFRVPVKTPVDLKGMILDFNFE